VLPKNRFLADTKMQIGTALLDEHPEQSVHQRAGPVRRSAGRRRDGRGHLDDVPERVRNEMTFHLAETYADVAAAAFA
jgi:hypothetical protein